MGMLPEEGLRHLDKESLISHILLLVFSILVRTGLLVIPLDVE